MSSTAQTPAATSRSTSSATAASTVPESSAQPQEDTPAGAFRYSISAGSATITEYIGSDLDCISICQNITRVDYRGITYSCDGFMSKFAQ